MSLEFDITRETPTFHGLSRIGIIRNIMYNFALLKFLKKTERNGDTF